MKNKRPYKFSVIGAGPSGILAVSYLLAMYKAEFNEILWIDPNFKGGDFVLNWSNVPSNTYVKFFISFLESCFSYDPKLFSKKFKLFKLDPESTCYLQYMAEPLCWITQNILKKVDYIRGWVQSIAKSEEYWTIKLSSGKEVQVQNIILAQGAESIKPSYSCCEEISLKEALDKNKLKKYCVQTDRIAVMGSSHSAVLVLKNLFELGQFSQLINFYRSSLRYASYLESGEILFDNTGLKGEAALFALEHLENLKNDKIMRIPWSEENLDKYLPLCTKIIYALGFQRREIKVFGVNVAQYDEKTGIIAPGLYGLGIAFPSHVINHLGEVEKSVGLLKFANHLKNIFPLWMKDFRG